MVESCERRDATSEYEKIYSDPTRIEINGRLIFLWTSFVPASAKCVTNDYTTFFMFKSAQSQQLIRFSLSMENVADYCSFASSTTNGLTYFKDPAVPLINNQSIPEDVISGGNYTFNSIAFAFNPSNNQTNTTFDFIKIEVASIPVESFESIVAKILDKSNDHTMKCFDNLLKKSNKNLEKVITLSNSSLEKIFEKFDSSLTLALSNSFERAVRSMSDAVTDSMCQLHNTMSTLSTSVSECQKQVLKLNETPMIEQMTKALWIVERERKDEERRANNVIISGLVEQSGINDRDIVLDLCEKHLAIKPQVIKTRRIGSSRLCVTLSGPSAVDDLIFSSRILRSKPDTRNIFINFDLSKRQTEQAYIKRQARRLAKSA
ncbi:hypothetical protein HELRODRAFT_184488, partial [Helobdella robusta]|uniref:Uncharacterized protein n=1 Tax=Helobdella robusta TaxID=6412 RepID=T1FLB0_HELRO